MKKSVSIIMGLLVFLSCSNFPEQINDNIPTTDFIPYFCFLESNGDICIIDVLGNNKKVIKSNAKVFGTGKSPKISKTGEYLAYLDNNDLYVKNFYNDQVELIDKYFKETKDYYALDLEIVSWSDNNDFFIYFRNRVESEYELKDRPDIKLGFYSYDIKNKKSSYIPQMGGFLQFIPKTNTILCYTRNEKQDFDSINFSNNKNNFSYYFINENRFEKFRNFPLTRSQFKMSGNKILAFVQFKQTKDLQTWIGFIDLIKNKEYQITDPNEKQNSQRILISDDGRFIIYQKEIVIKGSTSSEKYIVIHDIYKNKNEILGPASFYIYDILGKWFIYTFNKQTISKNLYTGEEKVIFNKAIFWL